MKKLIAPLVFSSLFFVLKVHAGLPFDQMTVARTQSVPGQGNNSPTQTTYVPVGNWNTSIAGSTNPASGTGGSLVFPVVQSTVTFNGGISISSYSARNCITDITATLSNASTFYILDGGTTDYVIYGAAIIDFSGATTAEWSKHWDHLGPFCGTAGNTLTLTIPTPSVATATNVINADGYTVITGLAANYNANQ